MAEKLGIATLSEVVVFGTKLGKTITDDLADKKISFSEVLALIPEFMKIPDFIAKKDTILAEAKDLSVDEVKQISTVLGETITNEKIVATVENVLVIAVSVRNLIDMYSKKTTPVV